MDKNKKRKAVYNRKRKKDGVDLIKFILEFIIKNDVVDISIANSWADHANEIGDTDKVQEWMGFVKNKIGAVKYYEIRKEYDNFCKEDCGFSRSTNCEDLVEEMFNVLT